MDSGNKKTINLPSRPRPTFSSIQEFSLGEELGEGAIATVRLATHKASGTKYAIKDVEVETLSEQDFENVEKELEIHRNLDHPFIIKLHDFFEENGHVYIILENAPNGNLFKHLTKNNPLDPDEIGRFWLQTVKAIEYLHSKRILMRDLKPENLLLDADKNIKVCDFGWATRMDDLEYKKLKGGTFAYMSPETLDGREQDTYSDVWSLGILLFELYHNREPFTPGDSCEEQLYFLNIGRIVYKMGLDRIVSNIIEKLLNKDFAKRITIEQIFKDPFTQPYLKMIGPMPGLSRSSNRPQKMMRPVSRNSKPIGSSSATRLYAPQNAQTKISVKPMNSIHKSMSTFSNPNSHLKQNLLSYQNTFRTGAELPTQSNTMIKSQKSTNSLIKTQPVIRTNYSATSTNYYDYKNRNQPLKTQKDHTNVAQRSPILVNQTSMGSENSNSKTHTHFIKTVSRGNLNSQSKPTETVLVNSSGKKPISRHEVKNIKDILNYYNQKEETTATKSHKIIQDRSANAYQDKVVERTATVVATSTSAYPNQRVKSNVDNFAREPTNTIQFQARRSSPRQIVTHQPFSGQHHTHLRPEIRKLVTKGLHKKTYSMDVRDLHKSLQAQKQAQYANEGQKTPVRNVVTRARPVESESSSKMNMVRSKSNNKVIKLQNYKFMRASKFVPNYSARTHLGAVVSSQSNTHNTLAAPVPKGMSKNRSYNDLKTYQRRLELQPQNAFAKNNYSQTFKNEKIAHVKHIPKVNMEYGIGSERNIVKAIPNGTLKRERSVRKINLANYHRSYTIHK